MNQNSVILFAKHDRAHGRWRTTKSGYWMPTKDSKKRTLWLDEKGRPPFLAAPLVPMNMIPYTNTANGNNSVPGTGKYTDNTDNLLKFNGALNSINDTIEKEKLYQIISGMS
jgi:hypothetical protein